MLDYAQAERKLRDELHEELKRRPGTAATIRHDPENDWIVLCMSGRHKDQKISVSRAISVRDLQLAYLPNLLMRRMVADVLNEYDAACGVAPKHELKGTFGV